MSEPSEERKLAILLAHWIEHNEGHAGEFRTWAERARKWGRADVGKGILEAAAQLEKANASLHAALAQLEGN